MLFNPRLTSPCAKAKKGKPVKNPTIDNFRINNDFLNIVFGFNVSNPEREFIHASNLKIKNLKLKITYLGLTPKK
jgi:hypothetical protein